MAQRKRAISAGGRWAGASAVSAERRETMIREVAYSLFEKRGGGAGAELQDWLAAEAKVDAQLGRVVRVPAAAARDVGAAADLQQSGARSVARDERLKRIIRQHPQRDIAQIESIEPPEPRRAK